MHFYITGDTHGNFSRIAAFCRERHTTKEDVLIILGDVGLNYFLDERDKRLKEKVAALDITLFCIHGNHEARPWEAEGYEEKLWMGARVYAEPDYPNLLFAKDGEIYTMRGKRVLAIGGAYSVDKEYRLSYGYRWFESEQPSEEIKAYTERQLKAADWRVDYVLSHTVPLDFEPVWSFLPGLDQSKVDKSTEQWLQTLHDRLDIREGWYAGHYHCCCEGNGLRILFEDYGEICREEETSAEGGMPTEGKL